MSVAPTDAQPSTIPTIPKHRVLIHKHAGCRPPGSDGAGCPGNPTKDASAARGTQLGKAELRGHTRCCMHAHTHPHTSSIMFKYLDGECASKLWWHNQNLQKFVTTEIGNGVRLFQLYFLRFIHSSLMLVCFFELF